MKLKVPIWEKMNLTIEEASVISNIGEHERVQYKDNIGLSI